MDYNNYNRDRYRTYRRAPVRTRAKQPSFFSYFIVGLIGALIGGLLFASSYKGIDYLPFERDTAPEADDGNGDSSTTLPDEYQRTEVTVAVERVTPAVVGISNYITIEQRGNRMLIEQAAGSGVVITDTGYIVTNQHVIEGAEQIDVVFHDGTISSGTLIGEDALTDLAVIKTEENSAAKTVEFSDSEKVLPGESAIAIGNPLGLVFQHTVTVGVVSAIERQVPIPGSQYRYTFIQTDAAINEGNSGGPLINLAGEVMGINSAKIKDTGVEGIGFAIPSNTVERVIDDLVEYGKVRRPFLGVFIQDLAEVTGNSTDRGVYINEVNTDGPAIEAGMRDGDVIVKIDDYQINFTAQLFDRLLHYQPGEEVTVTVERDNEEMTMVIELGEMPE